ncbi:ATP synthase F0 subunit B [Patescibacteria group bacterium]|nr:ATP synthase F0 subunit B [Patescibacteria group bacterium]
MDALIEAFGINGKLLLAQSVNFGLLVAGLTFFLYKPVLKILKERQELIEKGVRDAEQASSNALEAEKQRKEVLAAAEREAEDRVQKSVEVGKEERAKIVERAQAQSEALLKDAELQAAELSRKALKESEKGIARAAILAAEKILSAK